jgi:hypothetical protein
MTLDDLTIRNTKPAEKPFKLSDERGLFLLINPCGSKLWRFKYRFAGKEQLLALGAYPEVTLKTARAKRDEARDIISDGRDPSFERKAAKQRQILEAQNAFKAVALDFITKMVRRWSERHRNNAISQLAKNIFPALGNRPASTSADFSRAVGARGCRTRYARRRYSLQWKDWFGKHIFEHLQRSRWEFYRKKPRDAGAAAIMPEEVSNRALKRRRMAVDRRAVLLRGTRRSLAKTRCPAN